MAESRQANQITSLQRRLALIHRADLIMRETPDLSQMYRRFLELMLEAAEASAGTLYLVDEETGELVFEVVLGPAGVEQSLQGHRMPIGQGIVGHAARRGEPIWIPEIEHSRHWARDLAERSGYHPHNVLCLPLKVQERVIGVVQLFDHPAERPYAQADIDFLGVMVNDLALKVENAHLLNTSRQMVERLRALLEVSLELGATFDRDQLLHLILARMRQLVRAEAATIFELDETSGELVVSAATSIPAEKLGQIRVPPGRGIAGWVARHGETVLVTDVRNDPRFYPQVEEQTDLVTRSILCSPLVVQEQVPGEERVFRRRIVGVVQVLNKKEPGSFTSTDLEILEGLAGQAAVAIERNRLYRQISDMFTSAVMTLTEAMEAKDPYTEGHTRRVTTTSVAIARELGLGEAEVARIRTAALLHDIGKIGMPDAILNKMGRVTEEEMEIIRRHPLDGERILRPLHHLREAIRGIAEHHERYDGTGYPQGLRGEEISLDGRIIAVADTFDAITSTRSYRRAMSPERAIAELQKNAGRQFDPQVVEAFLRAWEKGQVILQADEGNDAEEEAP